MIAEVKRKCYLVESGSVAGVRKAVLHGDL